jgi:hypothetical protein
MVSACHLQRICCLRALIQGSAALVWGYYHYLQLSCIGDSLEAGHLPNKQTGLQLLSSCSMFNNLRQACNSNTNARSADKAAHTM